MQVSVYRYNPDVDDVPVMRDMSIDLPEGKDLMVLDVLEMLKAEDAALSFRRSCREGVCGSDGLNMNGKNGLACITPLADLREPVQLRPLPGLPVVRDLAFGSESFAADVKSLTGRKSDLTHRKFITGQRARLLSRRDQRGRLQDVQHQPHAVAAQTTHDGRNDPELPPLQLPREAIHRLSDVGVPHLRRPAHLEDLRPVVRATRLFGTAETTIDASVA